MKTDELIAALAADSTSQVRSIDVRILRATTLGAILCAIAFGIAVGSRPDIAAALATVRFNFKLVVTLTLLATSMPLILRYSRPSAYGRKGTLLLWVAPSLLLVGAALELATVPPGSWQARLIGDNAAFCLVSIPALSVLPAVVLLLALKSGAPTRPTVAGALTGLVASSIAATLYAFHCTDDSPLFVMLWYSLAIAIVSGTTALIGGKVLRW